MKLNLGYMLKTRFKLLMLALHLIALGANTTLAQNYPNKAVRIMAGEAGASTDLVSRLIAQSLS